jgi:hypothetical protein
MGFDQLWLAWESKLILCVSCLTLNLLRAKMLVLPSKGFMSF